MRRWMVPFSAVLAVGLTCALQAQAPPQAPKFTEIPIPAQADAIPLYAAAQPAGPPEQWEEVYGGRIVRNVVSPTLTPVLPDPAKATGAAVIVAPGGGFLMLSIDSEGYGVAHWLADHGVAAFVLKYRLRESPRDTSAFFSDMAHLLSEAAKGGTPSGVPPPSLEDATTAIRLVRSRATQWKIDPARVGMVGFSAGAFITLDMGLNPDKTARPDFIAPIYGRLSAREVPDDAPPMFTALAVNDPLLGKGSFDLVLRWRDAKRPVEFHLYDKGGHGFGMRRQGTTSDLWIDEFYAWMKDQGVLGKSS